MIPFLAHKFTFQSGITHSKTTDVGYLPEVTAPIRKEVYYAPPGEGTNGSRDKESQHQRAVCSSCLPDTKPTNVKHKITSYN